MLGARLVGARRVRLAATIVTLGLSTAFVLLLLSLASALRTLETDPGALGKRYQLTAALPPALAPRVRAIPGVEFAAPRYEVVAADSFSLGETIDVIAYPGDHTEFEAPPLVSGPQAPRRRGGRGRIGAGGRAWARARLDAGGRAAIGDRVAAPRRRRRQLAGPRWPRRVRPSPGAAGGGSVRALAVGGPADAVSERRSGDEGPDGARGRARRRRVPRPSRGAALVSVLRTILLAIAIVDGLVCLYALIQACALTVQERRGTVAVLRACGGGTLAVERLLAGAALALVVPAAIVGVLLERLLLGPALSRLAVNYATLELGASAGQLLVTMAGLAAAAAVAVAWVGGQAAREPVVVGLAAAG